MRLVSWTHTESHSQRVDSAESSQTTDSNGAGVNEGTGADTASKWVTSAPRSALALEAAHQVLAHSVGSTGTGETLILVWDALSVGVSNVVDRAAALLLMVDHLALGIDTAGVGKLTQVDTATILTTLDWFTVSVSSALGFPALHLGVALQSLGTQTHGSVVGHSTVSRGSTARGGEGAWVGALALVTHLLVTTVSIQQTAGQTHSSLAEVTLGTGNIATALLSAGSGHTGLAALAVRARPAFLDTDAILTVVPAAAVT